MTQHGRFAHSPAGGIQNPPHYPPFPAQFQRIMSILSSQADAGGVIEELMSRNRLGGGRHIYPLLEV